MEPNQIISAAIYLVREWNNLTEEQAKQIQDNLPFDFLFALGDLHDATLKDSPCIAGERMHNLS